MARSPEQAAAATTAEAASLRVTGGPEPSLLSRPHMRSSPLATAFLRLKHLAKIADDVILRPRHGSAPRQADDDVAEPLHHAIADAVDDWRALGLPDDEVRLAVELMVWDELRNPRRKDQRWTMAEAKRCLDEALARLDGA